MSESLGVGLALLAALGLAVASLAVRLGTDRYRVTEVLAAVFSVNLLVLVPVAVVVGYPAYALTPRAVVAFAAAGVLGSLLGRACYFLGIARLGASRAEPLKALLPLFAVGASVLVLDERVTPLLLGGVGLLVVGGVGVATVARVSPVTATGRRFRVDASFPIAAALLYGVDPVFTKVGLAEGTPAVVGVAVRTVAAAGGFLAYLAWRAARGDEGLPSVPRGRWLAVAGVANTAYLLAYYAALARAPVVVVAPVTSVSTLFVVAGAAAFLQGSERVTWRLVAAASLVVAGVTVLARA